MADCELYESADFFMVRTALLPFETFHQFNLTKDAKGWLLAFYIEHPLFQEAIAVASPQLHEALKKLGECPSKMDLNKIYPSLLKYFLRMISRTTPFGLFSSVSWGQFSDHSQLQISPSSLKKRVRPDMAWVQSLIKFFSETREVFKCYKVMANPSLIRQGTNLLLTKKSDESNSRNVISIRSTAASEEVLAQSKKAIPYLHLEERINSIFSQHDPKKISNCIDQLLQKEFLLSELSIAVDDPFQLSDLIQKTEISLADHPVLLNTIRQANCSISAYEACTLGQGLIQLEVAYRDIKAWKTVEYPLQVDTYSSMPLQLHHSVRKKIAQAATAIWLLSHQQNTSVLRQYHVQFLEKYGSYRRVPLLELLHDVKGLGIPAAGTEETKHETASPLTGKILSCLLDKEIVIDDLVQQLWLNAQNELSTAPLSLELYFELISDSAHDIDKGLYTLVFNPVIASIQAGNTFGRFLHLWEDAQGQCQDKLRELLGQEESLYPQAVFVEASFLPENPRTANVCFFKKVRKFQLQMHYQAQSDQTLDLEDILVGATQERLFLYSRKLSKEIVVSLSSAVNPDLAPPALKFMLDVSKSRFSHFSPMIWGEELMNAPYLPRIKYHDMVLYPARWMISLELLGLKKNAPSEVVEKALDKVLNENSIPDDVYLTHFDHRLLINWKHPDQFQLMVQHLVSKGELLLFERYSIYRSSAGQEERWHTTEFVVPLVKLKQYAPKSDLPIIHSTVSHAMHERLSTFQKKWIYTQLYLPKASEEEFVRCYLYPFARTLVEMEKIDQWFYIRYYEDKPQIRLRLHCASEDHYYTALDHFLNWVSSLQGHDLINNFSLQVYEREIERYGGLACMQEAETLFFSDSVCCSELLDIYHLSTPPFPLTVFAALGIIHYLKHFDGNLMTMLQFLAPMKAEGSLLTGLREQTKHALTYAKQLFLSEKKIDSTDFLLPQCDRCFCQMLSPMASYRKIIEEKEQKNELENVKENIIDSLLHMHCNRLLGTDHQLEKQARVLAWHLLKKLAHQAEALKI